MADGAGGFDPTSGSPLLPAEYAALQGQQLSRFGLSDEPTGPFGALARGIAAARGSGMTQDALGQITGAWQQAYPALLRAYQTDDPVAAIAQDPNAPFLAQWMMARQTPQQVAETKLRMGQAQLLQPQVAAARAGLPLWLQQIEQIRQGMGGGQPATAAPPGGGAGGAGGAGAGGDLPVFPARPTSAPTGQPNVPQGAPRAPAGEEDLVSPMPTDRAGATAYVGRLAQNPVLYNRFLQQLRQLRQQQTTHVTAPTAG